MKDLECYNCNSKNVVIKSIKVTKMNNYRIKYKCNNCDFEYTKQHKAGIVHKLSEQEKELIQ